jgi:PTS system nitrogen regulatory IIA component
MPFRNMTLVELAKHIGMDAREVRRMADRGRLPGQYIQGEWRFNSAQMLDWLQQELHFLDERDLRNLERAMTDTPDELIVGDLLALEAIELALPAKSRASVLREMVRLAERTGLVYDSDGLIEALRAREDQQSTALSGGFAFPHPRRPMEYATAEPILCIGRVPSGLPFNAPDGKLTDLFVLLITHDERHHLHVLARLSMLFQTELPNQLRGALDASEALTAVLDKEKFLLAQRR